MAKDYTQAALHIVGRKSSPAPKPSTTSPSLHKDYYSLDSGAPISFDTLSSRIQKRLRDIDRTTAYTMLDLFFLHANWQSFYSRTDSFTRYLKEELHLSKTHAYGMLGSVQMLGEYFESKGSKLDLTDFISELQKVLDEVGIRKLIQLSAMKDDSKYVLLENLLDGEDVQLSQTKPRSITKNTSIEGDALFYKREKILTFSVPDTVLRKKIEKIVNSYYSTQE
jgi:hypothetical protein